MRYFRAFFLVMIMSLIIIPFFPEEGLMTEIIEKLATGEGLIALVMNSDPTALFLAGAFTLFGFFMLTFVRKSHL